MHHPFKSPGFSLYELVGTLAIASIVLTLGLPAFGNLAANQRLTTEANALYHAVHLARQESIIRRRVISICPSVDGQNCDPGMDWSGGWITFVNLDRDWPAVRESNEPILRTQTLESVSRITANRRSFSLRATNLRATNGTVVFCDRYGRGTARAVVISYTGRPRIARQDSRGRAYRCRD